VYLVARQQWFYKMLNYSKETPIIFPYKKVYIEVNKQKELVYRPLALINVKFPYFSMNALIDSGSDKTISYMEPFGKMLGVNIEDFEGEPEELNGLTGSGKAWPKHMPIWIGPHRLNIPIFWMTKPYNIRTDYQMILGRKILFNNFDIIFREREKKVYFYKK